MHFPQLPDPVGWDVKATSIITPNWPVSTVIEGPYLQRKILADDWTCSQSGPVDDIHFWGSWRDDVEGQILSIHLSIHSDDPVGTGGTDPANNFSKPDVLLWSWDATAWTVTPPISTPGQGWYNPNSGEWQHPDHNMFHQINIVDIPEPFDQTKDEIYWLDITVTVAEVVGTLQPEWGWKTADVNQYPDPYTGMHYMDDAVWGDDTDGDGVLIWNELRDPRSGVDASLDLAFVITPEPATVMVLILGGLLFLGRRLR